MKNLTEIKKTCTIIKDSEQSFTVIIEDIAYKLDIELIEDNISIRIYNDIPGIRYELNYDFEDFIELNKMFSQYKDLKKIYVFLIGEIFREEILIEEKNGKLSLYLNDHEMIRIKFNKVLENDKKKCLKIKDMTRIVVKLAQKIKNLDSSFVNEKDSKCAQIESVDINASKIASKTELLQMKKWIGRLCEFDLLYRGTRDGKDSYNFHECCDDKGPTISIIESEDGSRFGGFTTIDWRSDEGKLMDRHHQTFLFSLNKLKKYSLTIPNDDNDGITSLNYTIVEIKSNISHSLCFGENKDIFISDNWTDDTLSDFPNSFGINENASKNELVPHKFKPIEIEVYSVKYNKD